jgi:hypothetical protein
MHGCIPRPTSVRSRGYGNHRVVFDADTGAFKRMWGAFGAPPGARTLRDRLPEKLPDVEGPAHCNVASPSVAKDGTVYLADWENRRLQVFTNDASS